MNDDRGGVSAGVPAKFKRVGFEEEISCSYYYYYYYYFAKKCKCAFCGYSSKNFQDLNFCSIFLKPKMKKKFVIWYK
ncbi:hypothetical protein HanRHA438_Chr05g0210041 [Helianthus annuus]|uniref:Uncharacterized protein n=1 Tax=Helianthus annuus TaxID=4232 RepID=A0A9K3NLH6_HELAN|nr:hypothetical protein HanXRQr2_Chr05g0200321 [Helianthus annuus]KAJ0569286.1 hypothetical protein HanHA300_Chr05g0164421 [Helianthus annuus]KAJ0583594.1 hypothetical protein HanHA89_Chr05g0178451 [Helianthus annuus]KAJ0917786.1 hypothetical protein HanRHA438_Chr05g0210041 [Helianthus annuus]